MYCVVVVVIIVGGGGCRPGLSFIVNTNVAVGVAPEWTIGAEMTLVEYDLVTGENQHTIT